MNINNKLNDVIIKINEKITINYDYIFIFLQQYQNIIDNKWIIIEELCQELYERIPSDITLIEFYTFVSDYCASKISYHPDYNKIASYICIKKMHYLTFDKMTDIVELLYYHYDNHNNHAPIISKSLYDIVIKNGEKINTIIDYNRDYLLDYFGIKTLERSYLFKIYKGGEKYIIERPQHLFMRVALGIHNDNFDDAIETYYYMSNKYFTHATPTLFNAGTNRTQMSSCFLTGIDDNLDNIFDQQKQVALISKWAGGIGIHMSSIRSKGSIIRGTNGQSDGIIPLSIVMNKISRYVNQGGKRGGAIAIYLEVHHPDIFEFCELRKANTGNDDNRARDLFLALWTCDLFMNRVKNNEMWSLMCPDECPNLNTTFGEEYEKLYIQYENDKKYKKQVYARDLWKHILECQLESGMPYIAYKDHANKKSNQKNLGTIQSSNLCIEIMEYSNSEETAVCNLASICLPRYIKNMEYDYEELQKVTRICVRNLNKIIDLNFYPSENAKKSNMKHRPIGLGIQGLADVYNIFEYSFESFEAKELNKRIFETIYYAAVDESYKLAQKYGKYLTFDGSPFSEGKLQYHLWGMETQDLITKEKYNWDELIKNVQKYGTRNSLLTALMPTASTSQIMKCSECFEPYMSNVFSRTTLAGEFTIINENLIKVLIKQNLWSKEMRESILLNKGSIQNITEISTHIKNIYKTAFEIPLSDIIKQSADRGPFIDQSQSMNLFLGEQNYKKLTSAHFYGWQLGLKTGMYYLRTTPAADALNFGLVQNKKKEEDCKEKEEEKVLMCRKEEGCIVCGS
jgi:ribonucleoside-diphosphate reductase alpha subunit